MEPPVPTLEHRFLSQFVGEWTTKMGDDVGRESGRMLGDVWLILEGSGETQYGLHHYIFQLGFDPDKGKFVGTFTCAMMAGLWVYEGVLEGNRLILYTRGPAFDGSGMANYRDVFTVETGRRIMTSEAEQADGSWTEFMRTESVLRA